MESNEASVPFLRRVARDLTRQHQGQLHRLGIILPSRRAERSLRHAFSLEADGPVMSPGIWSIESVMMGFAGRRPVSPVEQLLALYHVHQTETDAEALEDFLKWGPTLLRDFGEIDRHGVDAQALYRELKEVETLAEWGLDLPTDLMQRRLDLWLKMPRLYQGFHQRLAAEGLGTPGELFRSAVSDGDLEKTLTQWMDKQGMSQVTFVGFNALTPPEKELMVTAHQHLGATAYWDVDSHYFNDPQHEAGEALRALHQSLPKGLCGDFDAAQGYFATSTADFHSRQAPGAIGVAKAVGHLLEAHLNQHGNMDGCAVILPDESLLVPLLQALPLGIQEANVTMGLMLEHSAVYAGIDAFLQYHETLEQGRGSMPRKSLEATLVHPISAALVGDEKALDQALWSFRNSRRSHWDHADIINLFDEAQPMWAKSDKASQWLDMMRRRLLTHLTTLTQAWDVEPGRLCAQAMAQTLDWLPEGQISFATLRRLFKQFAAQSPVAFYGEPFDGLQVLGLLESRSLDFETVIIAPANEGKLPVGRGDATFLPNDLRRAYGLPIASDREAVTAYHVYRLLQRAKHVHLVHNNEPEGLGKGEPSRFVVQMGIELTRYAGIQWHEHATVLPVMPPMIQQPFVLPRSQGTMDRLADQLMHRGLSPSALHQYLHRPEDFYQRFLLGVYQEADVLDRMAGHALGNVLHKVHEKAFLQWQSTKQWPEPKLVTAWTAESLLAHFPGSGRQGPHVLTHKVAHQLASNYCREEDKRIQHQADRPSPWTIHGVEKKLQAKLIVDGREILLKGSADRIEQWPDVTVIVDLKTGQFKPTELGITSVDQWQKSSKSKALQLMFYIWLLAQQEGLSGPWMAGIDALRQPKSPVSYLSIDRSTIIEKDAVKAFESEVLIPLIREMLASVAPV